LLAILLLGMGCRSFSVPPRSASLLLLSRAMSASNPSLTKEVFSFMPVSSEALLRISSSMFSVVLICISMHQPCIYVKGYAIDIGGTRSVASGSSRSFGWVGFVTPRFVSATTKRGPPIALSQLPRIACTRPTFPSSSITLMPCGCVGLLVRMRTTTPADSAPVR
jgi:hypothetical protein